MIVRAGVAGLLAMLVLGSALAQDPAQLPCPDADKPCLLRSMKAHAVRDLDTWKADRSRPLSERIGPAPPHLLDYLTLDNRLNGYPQRPRAPALAANFLEDLRAAIAELPPQVWQLFGPRLIGLYLVDDLGGTGYTEFVTDGHGKPAAGFIVLDAALLAGHTANAWATWRENTPFQPQHEYKLEARIQDQAHDNRKDAIQYILLHELGHVLSIGGSVHPPWDIDPRDVEAPAAYPFFELSWTIDRPRNRYATRFDADFPQRANIRYYFGAKLAGAEMAATYASLEKTSFATLYAASHPGEDFAEAFASYVHVVLLQRPWEITISRGGETVQRFKSCWDETRCADKRKVLEEILKEGARD